MFVKHLKKGEIVYKEFEIPKYFFVLHSGVLAVEKQIEVKYSNLWPSPKKGKWTHLNRTQHVTKILQHITSGMYFGEH